MVGGHSQLTLHTLIDVGVGVALELLVFVGFGGGGGNGKIGQGNQGMMGKGRKRSARRPSELAEESGVVQLNVVSCTSMPFRVTTALDSTVPFAHALSVSLASRAAFARLACGGNTLVLETDPWAVRCSWL